MQRRGWVIVKARLTASGAVESKAKAPKQRASATTGPPAEWRGFHAGQSTPCSWSKGRDPAEVPIRPMPAAPRPVQAAGATGRPPAQTLRPRPTGGWTGSPPHRSPPCRPRWAGRRREGRRRDPAEAGPCRPTGRPANRHRPLAPAAGDDKAACQRLPASLSTRLRCHRRSNRFAVRWGIVQR